PYTTLFRSAGGRQEAEILGPGRLLARIQEPRARPAFHLAFEGASGRKGHANRGLRPLDLRGFRICQGPAGVRQRRAAMRCDLRFAPPADTGRAVATEPTR